MPLRGEQVYIVDAVRTALGRGSRQSGLHRERHPNELLGACYRQLLARVSIPPDAVDDVLTGCVEQIGEQSINVARNAWLQAGLPASVPAATIDRQCGSGQQAVNTAAATIAAGLAEIVVAGGVEHMGRIPMSLEAELEDKVGTPWPADLLQRYQLIPQGEAAELIAEKWSISRKELDELSLRSHRRADAAQKAGSFDAEVIHLDGVELDQGIRPDTSAEALAGLPPAFCESGKVTAGNSSQISDGASAVLLASESAVDRYQLVPIARMLDSVTVGTDPVLMLEGPIPVTEQLMLRNSLDVTAIGQFEINEAFASVLAMWLLNFEVDHRLVNPTGGAIALGHPLGCSGARLVTTLVHGLRRSGSRYGLVAMCCRGGLGTGTLVELAS